MSIGKQQLRSSWLIPIVVAVSACASNVFLSNYPHQVLALAVKTKLNKQGKQNPATFPRYWTFASEYIRIRLTYFVNWHVHRNAYKHGDSVAAVRKSRNELLLIIFSSQFLFNSILIIKLCEIPVIICTRCLWLPKITDYDYIIYDYLYMYNQITHVIYICRYRLLISL